MTTGMELRDQGVAAVISADTAAHRSAAPYLREALDAFIESGQAFSADDIREALAENVVVRRELANRPNLMPALIANAAKAGRIEAVGLCRPSRASRRSGRNLVWKAAA
ncbi:MAG TPA: hypothetical protein VK039_05575 [Brevibacterium sp.]|nr:hypothetical protein [Brevibacterium sp.]